MNKVPMLPTTRLLLSAAEQRTHVHIERTTVGGDVTVVAGDSNVTTHNHTHHHLGAALLRPRPVDRSTLLPRRRIVRSGEPFRTGGTGTASADTGAWGVQAFLGPDGSGRRTIALDALNAALPDPLPIFMLVPDWDTPDVKHLPRAPRVGYLLDLRGEADPLDDDFHRALASYATWAADNGTRLAVLADEHVWAHPATADSAGFSSAVLRTTCVVRPDSREVARRRLDATDGEAARAGWLDHPDSVFAGLLNGDEPPGEGVRLAGIIRRAENPQDGEARDEFLGWRAQLKQWFGGAETDAPPVRALQIAAAFLDGCPATTVLAAADHLLSSPALNWEAPRGGPLAGPDDAHRCAEAGVALEHGVASLARIRPGIDTALIRHVWLDRPRLIPVVTTWLSEITAPGGPAADELGKLNDALMATADLDDSRRLLGLVERWLSGSARQAKLASALLDRLAVHPHLGSQVRAVLADWAKSHSTPQRQHAVVAVCRGALGKERERLALTRLRYVLGSATDAAVRAAAVTALHEMAVDPERLTATVESVVRWATAEKSPDHAAFLALFEDPRGDSGPTPLLLGLPGEEGAFVRRQLVQGWSAVWACERHRAHAATVLEAWCDAAESGAMPTDPVRDIVGGVVTEYAAQALGDDLNRLIGGTGAVRSELRLRCLDAARRAQVVHGP